MADGRERIETETEMREWLQEAITDLCDAREEEDADADIPERNPRSFNEAGVLTTNEGIVITFPDGREFQITIVGSRTAR